MMFRPPFLFLARCKLFKEYAACGKCEGRIIHTFFGGIHCEVCNTKITYFYCDGCGMKYKTSDQ